jgi:hypothetical protein
MLDGVSLSLIQLSDSPGNRHDALLALDGNAGEVVYVFWTFNAASATPQYGFAPLKFEVKLIGCKPSGLEKLTLLNVGDTSTSHAEQAGQQQHSPIAPMSTHL